VHARSRVVFFVIPAEAGIHFGFDFVFALARVGRSSVSVSSAFLADESLSLLAQRK
jgi:hypothetical protein